MKNGKSRISLFLYDSKCVLTEFMEQANIQHKLNMWLA